MFIKFFYLLRQRGLKVSLNEWMALMDALEQGLGQSSLSAFYHLCRAVLIKSEADYDKFDMAFAEFFKGVKTPEEIPEEVWNWLDKDLQVPAEFIERMMQDIPEFDFDELVSSGFLDSTSFAVSITNSFSHCAGIVFIFSI